VLEGWWVDIMGGLVVGGKGTFEGLKSWQLIQYRLLDTGGEDVEGRCLIWVP
jgi:hypothetical protein